MISLLIGEPVFHGSQLTLLVGGVGYAVHVHARAEEQLRTQKQATLHIHTHVREDALDLFGFLSYEEKQLFGQMLDVSGVGPKTALNLVSLPPDNIIKAVQEGNVSFFSAVPRVGKKLAQKIIIELKPKLGSIEDLVLSEPRSPKESELEQALTFLGYAEDQIRKVVRGMDLAEITIQDAIKSAVKKIGEKA